MKLLTVLYFMSPLSLPQASHHHEVAQKAIAVQSSTIPVLAIVDAVQAAA